MRVGGRQRRDPHELGVGLGASEILLLGVVHGRNQATQLQSESRRGKDEGRVVEPSRCLGGLPLISRRALMLAPVDVE